MNDKDVAEFVKSRDEAFMSYVMDDSLEKFHKHCKKYGVEIPENETVLKVGILKAVQECTDIPEDIKLIAFIKCSAMGFNPYIDWREKEYPKREDCYYYHEEHDMGATIPCCNLRHALGDCPCTPDCKDYISDSRAFEIVRKYQEQTND